MSMFLSILPKADGRSAQRPVVVKQVKQFIAAPTSLQQVQTEAASIAAECRAVFHADPHGLAADRFRLIRMHLREQAEGGRLKTLLVTSALPQDGKSTIAVNLATALAERGRRNVLLLEADLHRPSLMQRLGLIPGPGLAECLEDGINPLSLIRRLEPLGWYLLQAGHSKGNPGDLLQSQVVSDLLQTLRPAFDWILIDSPPVNALADTVALARRAEGTLLVVRASCTQREEVDAALKSLGPANVIGVVLNGVRDLERSYSKYCGYYRKRPAADDPVIETSLFSPKTRA